MKNTKAETHEGNVVSVDGDKFTSKCTDGKMLHHILATGATVTCDGKDCKLADLKPGTKVRVTMQKDDSNIVTAVECGTSIHAAAGKV